MPSQRFVLNGDDDKYLRGRQSMLFHAVSPKNGVQFACPDICASPAFIENACKTTYTPNPLRGYKSTFTMDPMNLQVDYSFPGPVTFYYGGFVVATDMYDPYTDSLQAFSDITANAASDLYFEFRGALDSGVFCRLRVDSEQPQITNSYSFADTDGSSSVLSWNVDETFDVITRTQWTGTGASGNPRKHTVSFEFSHVADFTAVYSGGPDAVPDNKFVMSITYTYGESDQTAAYWKATDIHNGTLSPTSTLTTITHRDRNNALKASWTAAIDSSPPSTISVRRA